MSSSQCTKPDACTSACSDPTHATDKNVVNSLSADDCALSDKSISSQCKSDLVTSNRSCRSESADGFCESASDAKCTTVDDAEKQSRGDRRQRREKRPEIQRYVPRPKQTLQHDASESLAYGTVSAKLSDHKASRQSESASDQKKGNNAESRKSAAASLLQPAAGLASDTSKNSEPGDTSQLVPQLRQSESSSAAEHCSSKTTKSSATSLPHTFGSLSLSDVKATELEESGNKPGPGRVKQKVAKPQQSQSNEQKQEASECSVSGPASRKADIHNRVKISDRFRSENLDWDFDGEFEYNHDGVSWGDLPPPSDHDGSDEESHDDNEACGMPAAKTQKQKPQKLRVNRRRSAKKKQTQNAETLEDVNNVDSERRLTGNSRNVSTAVETSGFEYTKHEKTVATACRFAKDRELPLRSDEMSSKNRDVDDHNTAKISTKSYSRRRKDAAEKLHWSASEQRLESKEQRRNNRNTVKSDDRQHCDIDSKESVREENTRHQRPDSGKVGGIIHLPVGTVTTVSHDTAHSAPSQMSASTRGRNRRPVHGSSRSRALWSPDKLDSSSVMQRPGLPAYEPTQLHASYPADYYQRQSASPQLYYAEYPPVSGASPMPPVDAYVYGYPPVAYDGVGYVDDSYYH